MTGSFTNENSPRVSRFMLSYSQDIIYAVSCGKIKTLKYLLLPHTIKKLKNYTELVKFLRKLGHGAFYTVIEELDTESTCKMIEKQQQNKVILPDGRQEVFTRVVTVKIAHKEQTLSGKNISFTNCGANCL